MKFSPQEGRKSRGLINHTNIGQLSESSASLLSGYLDVLHGFAVLAIVCDIYQLLILLAIVVLMPYFLSNNYGKN